MKYRVGDVARVLGLTPGALHYYEREGLMNVDRAQSGHRYYDVGDLWRLLSYKKYHAMGSPIKEVMNQFTGGGSRVTIASRVRARRDEALDEARRLEVLAGRIDEHLRAIERIDELLNQYAFERSPDCLFAGDKHCGWISLDHDRQDQLHAWVEAMPSVRLSILWPVSSLDEKKNAILGYSINTSHAESAPLSLTPGSIHLPASSCIHTVVTAQHDFIYCPETAFELAADYARMRGFQLDGTPWGTILLVETAPDGLFRAYVELWIPVC